MKPDREKRFMGKLFCSFLSENIELFTNTYVNLAGEKQSPIYNANTNVSSSLSEQKLATAMGL